jgi:hypothetical protein
MRRCVLLAILLALAGVGTAQAWTPQVWQTSLDVARTAWPDSPCAGKEQVNVTDNLPADADGQAHIDGTCRVDIRPGLSDYRLCAVMVHEFGHLDGRTHQDTGDHEGVMGPPGLTYSPCLAVFPTLTPRALAASLFTISPSRCVLARATPASRLYRCGLRQHALVQMSGGVALTADRL